MCKPWSHFFRQMHLTEQITPFFYVWLIRTYFIQGLLHTGVLEQGPGAAKEDASEEEDMPIGRGLKRAKPSNPGLGQEGFQEVVRRHLESRKRLKLMQDGLEGMEDLLVKSNGGLVVDLEHVPGAAVKGSAEKQRPAKKGKARKVSEDGSKVGTGQIETGAQAGAAAAVNEGVPAGTKVADGALPERKKRKYVRKQKPVVPVEVVAKEEVIEKESNGGKTGSSKGAGNVERDGVAGAVQETGQVAAPERKASSPSDAKPPPAVLKSSPPKLQIVTLKPEPKHDPLLEITEESAGVLDLGWGVHFLIPPYYDDLAPTLGLPTFDMVQIDEKLLSGGMRSAHLAALVREEAARRAAKMEALERAEAEKMARDRTATPTPSGKGGRVPDGQRCSVCRSVKKGGCGSANAHPRCKKRAMEGFPFLGEDQEAPTEGFKGLGGVNQGVNQGLQGDPSFLARAGALHLLQTAHAQAMMGQLQGVFTPEQLAVLAQTGPGGLSLDAMRRQAELAASALAWQALPQGALQAGVAGVKLQPPSRVRTGS